MRPFLGGLTHLSAAAAESLSKQKGELYVELDNFQNSIADILLGHPSFIEDDDDDGE